MKKHENIFLLTDLCMWENNKKSKTFYPHAIQVVDTKTGQVRYIKSGSKIAFIEGEITEGHSQETYNTMSSSGKKPVRRKNGKAKINNSEGSNTSSV